MQLLKVPLPMDIGKKTFYLPKAGNTKGLTVPWQKCILYATPNHCKNCCNFRRIFEQVHLKYTVLCYLAFIENLSEEKNLRKKDHLNKRSQFYFANFMQMYLHFKAIFLRGFPRQKSRHTYKRK